MRKNFDMKVTDRSMNMTVQELGKFDKAVEDGVVKIIDETAMEVHRDTVQNAPVITGSLKTSYQIDNRSVKREKKAHVYTEIEYAPNVEFGIRQSGTPHFVPAIEKAKPRFEKAMDNLLKRHTR